MINRTRVCDVLFIRLTLRRWYGFLGMQMKIARAIPRVVTVSESSRRDIVQQMGVREDRLHIVPVGVDPLIFRPRPEITRVPGRLMTTASADAPSFRPATIPAAIASTFFAAPPISTPRTSDV